MAASSTLDIAYTKTGMTGNETDSARMPTVTNASAPGTRTRQTFSAGVFAAVSVQTGAAWVIMNIPSTNVGAITMKGITGDTGIGLHPTNPGPIPLASGATFGLLCAADTIIEFVWG